MSRRAPIRSTRRPTSRAARGRALLGSALFPTLVVAGISLLGAYAILGPNGLLALGDYKRTVAAHERQYAALDVQRATLRNRVGLLDPRHANPDMVDELVRKELNVAHPDEVVVPLN